MESLGRSMEKFRLAAVVALVAFQVSCNSNTAPDNGAMGTVRAALTGVPADVSCVRVEVQGARTTSQDFDVTPGMNATLLLSGVSTGPVVITAEAFPVSCAALAGMMISPNWVSDPVSTTVGTSGVTDVSVVMHRNGQVSVGITFTDDPTCTTGTVCATCTDMRKNGTETDVDCGGGACPLCANGKICVTDTDCASAFCSNGICSNVVGPTCQDMLKNGSETDVDCGGAACPQCADGKACATATDCVSSICTNGICGMAAIATCADMRKNQNETDVDCGGICPPCADGKACSTATDCVSSICTNGICGMAAIATCADMRKNQNETDVDCGGICPPCADGKTCSTAADCVSSICTNGICGMAAVATCADMQKNQNETDVDCGGICPPCADGKTCSTATDCVSGACTGGICGPIESKMCIPPSTGTVAWWHADDNFGDSIGGAMGIPLGNVTFAPGIHNDGFLFDGSPGSQVEGPAGGGVSLDTQMTIDAWINPTADGGSGRIVDKIQPFGGDGYLLDLQGFHLRAIVGGSGLSTGATIPVGVFTHVAMTYDPATTLSLYINGVVAEVVPLTGNGIPVNTHPIMFGGDQGGGSLYAGVIDEIRLWNQALSQAQIQQLVIQGPVCP